MREDMARVIVERRASNPQQPKGRRPALEDLPSHEGMRRAAALRGDRKELNENLAPLRRYLEGQVGRPWDKAYAEIAARLRIDSTVQQHVRDHLRDFVAVAPRRNVSDWSPLFAAAASGGSRFMSIQILGFSAALMAARRKARGAPNAIGHGRRWRGLH